MSILKCSNVKYLKLIIKYYIKYNTIYYTSIGDSGKMVGTPDLDLTVGSVTLARGQLNENIFGSRFVCCLNFWDALCLMTALTYKQKKMQAAHMGL